MAKTEPLSFFVKLDGPSGPMCPNDSNKARLTYPRSETRSSGDRGEETQLRDVGGEGCVRPHEELGPGELSFVPSSAFCHLLLIVMLKGHPC